VRTEFSSWAFNFVVDIYTDGDDNEVERDIYAATPYFWDSHDRYGYEKWKIILKNSSVISLISEQKCRYPKWSWLEKLIRDGKTAIGSVDIGLSYKIFSVLCMLHTFFIFMRLKQIAKSLMLSMSPSSRGHNLAI